MCDYVNTNLSADPLGEWLTRPWLSENSPDLVSPSFTWCFSARSLITKLQFWKKIPPPPLETLQFYFLYSFLSVFETRKVLCKKAVRKDENWFSADLQTPKRQKFWDSEPKAGKSSEMYRKVEKVRCIKFPAWYKWRISLKLEQWTSPPIFFVVAD